MDRALCQLSSASLASLAPRIVTEPKRGLFPSPAEISLECSCPDWATMCKHVAAVLYGVGARLDAQPELLFVLRQVDHAELIVQAAGAVIAGAETAAMDKGQMESVFGIEIDEGPVQPAGARRRTVRPQAISAPERRASGRHRKATHRLDLDARCKKLRAHFLKRDALTNAEYREIFSVTPLAATLELGLLVRAGRLLKQGAKRGTRYFAGLGIFPVAAPSN